MTGHAQDGSQDTGTSEWVLGVPNPEIETETDITLELERCRIERRPFNGAWVTLLTKQTYLPGLIVLNDSLQKVASQFPLVVLYTSALEQAAVDMIKQLGIKLQACEYIHPPAGMSHIADRFVDTWTKLRICELDNFERVVMIDNDMLVLQNMDELFWMQLERDQIAATHGCICNLDRSSWAPDWFTVENCPYTGQTVTSSLMQPAPTGDNLPPGHRQLNSGLVVLEPNPKMKDKMERYIANLPKSKTFLFPDQDVLVGVYGNNWRSLSWTYNAVKISREWHAHSWDDKKVKNLHYICDKPWQSRNGKNEEDVYLHHWWWRQWDGFMARLTDEASREYLETLVAHATT